MADNPVVMARRAAVGLVLSAVESNKDEHSLIFEMYMEDMSEIGQDRERALKLLLMATVGLSALIVGDAEENVDHLNQLAMSLAGV